MKRVLVLAPHPDDESIGCGGTLRQHVVDGDEVHAVILTSGEKGGHGRDEAATRRLREKEARRAAAILGLRSIEFWGQPDGGLRATPSLAARLGRKMTDLGPAFIYLPHEHDAHPDHRETARLVRRALRQLDLPGWQPVIRCYEVWTPIGKMSEIVDISAHMRVKRAAVRTYRSQCAVLDFEAAVVGLNRYRGEMHSWPGGDFAEVFAALRR